MDVCWKDVAERKQMREFDVLDVLEDAPWTVPAEKAFHVIKKQTSVQERSKIKMNHDSVWGVIKQKSTFFSLFQLVLILFYF